MYIDAYNIANNWKTDIPHLKNMKYDALKSAYVPITYIR